MPVEPAYESYRLNEPRFAAELIEQEVLVIDMETGTYFSLRDSAAAIWRLAVSGQQAHAIGALLAQRYGRAEEIQADTDAFLHLLAAEALFIPGHDPVGQEVLLADLPLPQTYAKPVLDRYDDMQALLLLDPIHDVDLTGWPLQPQQAA